MRLLRFWTVEPAQRQVQNALRPPTRPVDAPWIAQHGLDATQLLSERTPWDGPAIAKGRFECHHVRAAYGFWIALSAAHRGTPFDR
jgi:hypothetical protein